MNTKRNWRKNRTSVVQGLYDMCKAVFAECGSGVVPSREDVSRLSSYLERMKPEELGLSPNMQYFRHVNSDLPPPVTYLHIIQCPNFSIGIFCLPTSAVIPLHDHPGMTAFSKILFGSMHIKSYDWVLSSQPSDESATVMNGEGRLAKVKVDAVFNAPCANSILYPEAGGNMHCFTAITACAVLDVLGPPYSRDCTYYDAFPLSSLPDGMSVPSEDGEYALLRAKREMPRSFKLEVGNYDGPTIVERIGNPKRSPESIDLFSTVASNHNKKGPSHHHNSSEPSDFRLTMPMKISLDETIESFQRTSPVGDSPDYGRENEKNSIIGFLLSDDFNRKNLTAVCMVGESGIGKTSLAHLIYSEERILDSFDARIFITMPEKSDETRLIKKLFESVTSSPCPTTEADLLEELLVDELSGTKVFVVLDDADNENPFFWDRIVTILNHSTRGSILMVTTKSKDVAEVMGAMKTHRLDPLSDSYCWKLFWQHIFTGLNTNVNTDLVETGKKLVSKCQHNPLCIKVVAGLLVCLKNVEPWVEILKTDLLNMDGFDGDTLSILRVCYETLPDNLKKCLHYCSLFPKDYVFAKQQIVRMWMSQGFIVAVEQRQPEEVGLQNFDELLLRGFFQHSPLHDVEEDKYIMHDLIRALATHFSINESASTEDAVERILENCFHFSLDPSVIQIDKMKPLIKEASDLQSFLVLTRLQTRINISILDITSLSDLFTKCINLRTLDLSCTDILELPSSVGMLKQLRYLGVNNTKIRSIPRELCSLVSLQTLEAKDCQHLVELPESMMELTNLRHLDVSKKSGCVKMMIGIGQLTNLQSLSVFCVGCEMPYCSIRELKDLNCLSSCLQIAGLENITYGLDAKEAALHNKVHLNTLWLHWNDNRTCIESEESVTISEEVLKNLKPNPNIGELIIRNYRGNLFPTWMGDPSFSELVSIILDKCLNCSQFPALGGLPSLRHLSVQKLYHLVRFENTDSQFVSKNTPKFPSLETLNLWEMYDLEELFETSDCDFPCLHTLSISRCPMLKSVPCFSSLLNLSLYCCVKLPYLPDFPSLKSFRIDGFKKIKSLELPKDLPALKELEIRHCNELLLVEGLPKLRSLKKLNVVHCPNFDPFKNWKPCHSKPISTTRWFFQKEESTTQMEHQETTEPAEKHTEVVVTASLDDSKKRTRALNTDELAEKRTKVLKTAEPVEKHTKQRVVVQLGELDSKKMRAKALKTVVVMDGIISASLDGNRLVVVCEGTDLVAMIILLRKKLGYAELVSITSGYERIREEQENKISSGSNSLGDERIREEQENKISSGSNSLGDERIREEQENKISSGSNSVSQLLMQI